MWQENSQVTTPKLTTTGGFFTNIIFKSDTTLVETGNDDENLVVRRESKELFAVIRGNNAIIQQARWPSECQVLHHQVRHILYNPAKPEPLYVPTGREIQPKPCGEESGIIVYQYYPISAVNYFNRSSVGGSNFLLPTLPAAPEHESLIFESRFESGNLAKAVKITAVYYELYLRTDMYTNKHMQWFYFRISHMKKNQCYRFSIVNLTKDGSLFNEGMRPVMYSTRSARLYGKGWFRCGDNITYFCNDNVSSDDPELMHTYTLSFTLEFPYENDEVYLAYNYPYTYTDLQEYLLAIAKHPVKSTFTTLRLLCRTLAGNNVYYVTITAPEKNDGTKKKGIILTARVHPGETPASWMMKGVLDFLTSDSSPAKELREKFIFKIIPMLNPDGVIVGNNRCSLTGRDLNRQYRTVIRETYPSIWYTKLIIRRMLEGCGVAMYCDFHAHSRKHNIFVYGCENRRGVDVPLLEQIFPLMLRKNASDKFSFENCKFKVQRAKEGTGRVVMWLTGITHSYTLEASFAGSRTGNRQETHFSTQDYESMGKTFCQTLLDFFDNDPRQERLRSKIVERLISKGSTAEEPLNIPLSDYSSDEAETTSSSSNEGRDDYSQPLPVPPPSPTAKRSLTRFKFKPKPKSGKKTAIERRKPFALGKTNFNFTQKQSSSSDSGSDSDGCYKKIQTLSSRRRARQTKRQSQKTVGKHSDTEIQKTRANSLSVMDLLPCGKFRSKSWNREKANGNKTAPPAAKFFFKTITGNKHLRTTTQQLVEVQAKLIAIRKRLWFTATADSPYQIPLTFGSKFAKCCSLRAKYRECKVKQMLEKKPHNNKVEAENARDKMKTDRPQLKSEIAKPKTTLQHSGGGDLRNTRSETSTESTKLKTTTSKSFRKRAKAISRACLAAKKN